VGRAQPAKHRGHGGACLEWSNLLAAGVESESGTKRTTSHIRNSAAIGGKPDMTQKAQFGRV